MAVEIMESKADPGRTFPHIPDPVFSYNGLNETALLRIHDSETGKVAATVSMTCLLYTSPSPRD